MKVYTFPADLAGCGFYRISGPSRVLQNMGVDVTVVDPGKEREVTFQAVMDGDRMVDVQIPADADVIVLQRVSHRHIAQAVRLIRARGVAVVVEIDDDLTCIDPRNPAFNLLHPRGPYPEHSWHNTLDACRDATMVVVSTPALLTRFANHGRGVVYENYVPAAMLQVERQDSGLIGWGGSIHSHPTDLQVMGPSVSKLMREGLEFGIIGNGEGVHDAWGLPKDAPMHVSGVVPLEKWGEALSGLGVGVAPLADTKFNAAKSWLKMAEMAAVGVPCVGSPRAEYQRLASLGVGELARTPAEWERKLRLLATNEQAREEMSQRGREVMMGMTIEANAWKLAEIWKDALRLQRGKALGAHSRRSL